MQKGALYTKRKEGLDQENGGPLRRGWTWNSGNKNTAACLEWLALHGKKVKLMEACLKGLWTWKSEKYCSVKRGCLSVYCDNDFMTFF